MTGPGWLAGTFAALMLTVAAYCTGRLLTARRRRRPTELDTDGAHILMGVAMVGMLVTGLRTLPATVWTGVFGAGAAWFGCQTLRARRGAPATLWRCPQPGPHLVECAAMLYMLLAVPAAGRAAGMGGMGGASTAGPPLALLLALFLLGWVVRLADRLTVRAPAFAAPLGLPASGAWPASGDGPASAGGCGPADAVSGRRHLAPRCAVLCKIAMGITMGYMLIVML